MPVRKQFELYELFNLVIMKMRTEGIQDGIFKEYEKKHGGKAECGKREKGSSLGMKSLISAFIIQFAGWLLCVLVLFGEIAWQFI